MLQVTNVSEFRKNLKKYIDGVAGTHHKVIINSNGKSVVVMSLDEYNGMDETDYLLSSEENKKRLDAAIKSFQHNEGIERNLIEP
jgi:antitoxin YefM